MSTLAATNLKNASSASNNIVLDTAGNIAIQAGTAALPSLYPGTDTNTGIWSPAADTLAISTGGSERLRADADGLKFNGDTAAVNALDDYEEGTWTVQFYDASTAGNLSSTTATGYYTKVGKLVTITFSALDISTAGLTAGNIFYFTLPFTSATGPAHRGVISADTLTFTSGYLVSTVSSATTRGTIVKTTTGAADASIIVSNLSTGVTDLVVTNTYQSA